MTMEERAAIAADDFKKLTDAILANPELRAGKDGGTRITIATGRQVVDSVAGMFNIMSLAPNTLTLDEQELLYASLRSFIDLMETPQVKDIKDNIRKENLRILRENGINTLDDATSKAGSSFPLVFA